MIVESLRNTRCKPQQVEIHSNNSIVTNSTMDRYFCAPFVAVTYNVYFANYLIATERLVVVSVNVKNIHNTRKNIHVC